MARLGAAAGAGVAALMIIAITLWYFGQAIILALEAHGMTPAAAHAIAGVVGLVLVGAIGGVVSFLFRRRRVTVRATAPGNPTADAAAQLGGIVAEQLMGNMRDHPFGAAGAALAAGLAVGAIPELRDLLKGVMVKH
ncbi:MAG TPA: hypothetical protein VGG57_14405 [Stellaceae bacterium]|jgi:hypothetical protein